MRQGHCLDTGWGRDWHERSARVAVRLVAGGLVLLALTLAMLRASNAAGSGAGPAGAAMAEMEDGAMVRQLNTRTEELLTAGRVDAALATAEQAALLAKRGLGPDDPDAATSLNNLGVIYGALGRFAEAEALHRQALASRERARGPDHEDTAESLLNLATLYDQMGGRAAEAESLFRRSLDIHERALGPNHQRTALSLGGLGNLLARQSRFAEAEPLIHRALAILQQTLGPDHPDAIAALNNLAALDVDLGRYAEAEPLFRQALEHSERVLGPDHPAVVEGLNNLAVLLQLRLGRPAEAEPLFRRALAIEERLYGPDHPGVGSTLNNLAQVVMAQGRYAEAEALARRALTIGERTLGRDHPEVASILDTLGNLAAEQGRPGEAEPLFRRALAIREQALGPDHPTTIVSVDNLAGAYAAQGRLAEVEPLYRRALAANERVLGPDHPTIATSLNNLARLLTELHRDGEVEALYRRALDIRVRTLGPDHPELAGALSNLAGEVERQQRLDEAETLYRRAAAIAERALGPDHPDVARILSNLAANAMDRGRPAEAAPLYRQAAEIIARALGPDHPQTAQSLYNTASPLAAEGRLAETLPIVRQASGIIRRWLDRMAGSSAGAEALARTTVPREILTGHFLLLGNLLPPEGAQRLAMAGEMFEVAQLVRSSQAAQALARMAVRVAAGSDALAGVVRERQDAAARWNSLDAQRVALIGRPPADRDSAAEQRVLSELATLEERMAALDATLARDFSAYAGLVRPDPLTAAQAQALLRPDEALVVYDVEDRLSYAWVIRPDRTEVRMLLVPRETLAATVAALRQGLDGRGTVRVDAPVPRPRGFDVAAAHTLYRQIWEPLVPLLAGARHVMVVPDGPLQGLPFAVLVTAPPATPPQRAEELRGIAWLLRDYALTTLPAANSLRVLRTLAPARVGRQQSFVGFGDPVLRGRQAADKPVASLDRGGMLTDLAGLRALAPLPETAGELRALAASLGAGEDSLYLGPRATERQVRGMDLSRIAILAFATHGLMAGELPGLGEPGLVLTPPEVPSEEDDGLLAASAIATLRLDADWVILSACNTAAAADGTPEAEGLSGLARAFFYAGARSLLVSHWAVSSEAAVALTTGTLAALAADPALGRAEALRRTMLALVTTGPDPRPAYWAPFALVSEGGVPTQPQ